MISDIPAHKTISVLDRYHPLFHDCQTIWNYHLIPHIICQCQDQKVLLTRPDVMHQAMEAIAAGGLYLSIALSVITQLRYIGFLPFQIRWCSKSSLWGYFCIELYKCLTAMVLLPYIYKYYMQGKKLTYQVVPLVRSWIVAAFLSTIFSFLRPRSGLGTCTYPQTKDSSEIGETSRIPPT